MLSINLQFKFFFVRNSWCQSGAETRPFATFHSIQNTCKRICW